MPQDFVARALALLAPELSRARGEKVLVALSGGADSTALADLVLLTREALGLSGVEFLHVDHRLRPESTRDAKQVQAWFRARGVEVKLATLDSTQSAFASEGVEGWARRERYRVLEQERQALGCRWILTGHHRDDQAETVVMRLSRGCGFAGLVGIVKCDPKRNLLRPLLETSSRALRQWCLERELPWIEDESNCDERYARNEVRRRVLPLWERREAGVSTRLAGVARVAGALIPPLKRWATEVYPAQQSVGQELLVFAVDPEDLAIDDGSLFRLAVDAATEGRHWPSIDFRRWSRMVRAVVGMRRFGEMLSPGLRWEVVPSGGGWRLRFVSLATLEKSAEKRREPIQNTDESAE